MRFNSLNYSKTGPKKITDSYCPAILLERQQQAINLTNYRIIFGHMQDPRVLFISYSSDQFKGLKFKGRTSKVPQSDFTAADHTSKASKNTLVHLIFRTQATCLSLKGFFCKEKNYSTHFFPTLICFSKVQEVILSCLMKESTTNQYNPTRHYPAGLQIVTNIIITKKRLFPNT